MTGETSDIVINARIQLLKDKVDLSRATKAFNDLKTKGEPAMRKLAEAQDRVYASSQKLNQALGKTQFPGWALSIMFFGMALQRVFNSIWSGATRAFNEVQHSVYGSVTAFDNLNGSMMYLQYTMGEALGPLTQWLAELLEKVADFAAVNAPTLGPLITAIGIMGASFAIGGTGYLALNGLGTLVDNIRNLGTASSTLDTSKLLKGLEGLAGLAAITISFVIAKQAIDDLSSGKVFQGVLEAMSAGLMAAGGGMLLAGVPGGGYLVAIAVGLELIGQSKFLTTLMGIAGVLIGVGAGFGAIMEQIGEMMWSAMWAPFTGESISDIMSGAGEKIKDAFGTTFKAAYRTSLNMGVSGDAYLQGLMDDVNGVSKPSTLLPQMASSTNHFIQVNVPAGTDLGQVDPWMAMFKQFKISSNSTSSGGT